MVSQSSLPARENLGSLDQGLRYRYVSMKRPLLPACALNNVSTGNCVATLGTGELVRDTETVLALLPTHCYAIIGEHCRDPPVGLL